MPSYIDVLNSPRRPKIGVVLSSGGIRPFAAIELFDFLEQHQIPIDLLVGCSGGSITCTLKAMGMTVSEMRQSVDRFIRPELFQIDYKTIAALFHLPFTQYERQKAILKGDIILKNLEELYGERRLENLLIKTVLQTTNMETGEGVVLTEGKLSEAVYASSAIMPFFPPIKIGNHWLSDGVFSAPLPILEAVARGIDIIIAMDFSAGIKFKPINYFEYFNDFSNQAGQNTVHFQNSLAVDIHHYEIIFMEVDFGAPVSMWETKAIPIVYEKGKIAVEKAKQQIIEAIELFPESFKA